MTDHGQEPICYCFGFTAEDIRCDLAEHGRSRILEKICTEKRQGHCQCASKNPSGR